MMLNRFDYKLLSGKTALESKIKRERDVHNVISESTDFRIGEMD